MKVVVALFLFAISAEGAYEGDSCNKDGAAGVCKYIRDCPAAIEDLKNRKPPQNCGFGGGDPIVCCLPATNKQPGLTTTRRSPVSSTTEYVPPVYDYIDLGNKAGDGCEPIHPSLTSKPTGQKAWDSKSPVSSTTEYVPPVYDYIDLGNKAGDGCEPIHPSLTSKPTGQKAWDKCLEYQDKLVFPCGKSQALGGGLSRTNRCHHNADELIIGGQAAEPDEFPHMALLGYGEESNLAWLCGGSLISERFILTAGHCTATRDGSVSFVQLGTLRRSSLPAKTRFRVKRIIKHPQYDPPNKYHDIALLELEQPVPLNEYLVPACVHTGAPVNDSRASATGWGLTAYNGKNSDYLQKVIMTKFDPLECAVTYKPNRLMETGLDDRTQICFGDRTKSKDTCQGDSGGPLQIKNKQIACMYTIIGVTSFGSACGFVGVPGIYTRMAPYLDWIETNVWPARQ